MTTALPEPRKATVQDHVTISHRFLEHARTELDQGRRLQASQKIWGAVAHSLKAIGEKRLWNHHHNQHVKDIGHHLAKEFDQQEFHNYVTIADAMHLNFYKNESESDVIRHHLGEAEKFVGELDDVRQATPRPFTILEDADLRRLGCLLDIRRGALQQHLWIGGTHSAGFSGNPSDGGEPLPPPSQPQEE